jgi:hypothetical protein
MHVRVQRKIIYDSIDVKYVKYITFILAISDISDIFDIISAVFWYFTQRTLVDWWFVTDVSGCLPLKKRHMVCSETSVKNLPIYAERKVPEERRSHLCGSGGNLKSHIFDITSIDSW